MDISTSLLLFAAALAAGAINAVAGGGTFLTFPALVFAGYSPIQANIASTLALWPGSLASAAAYRREWHAHRHILPPLLIISVLGGGMGAYVLLHTPEATFNALVPWLLLAATLIFTFGRRLIALLNRWTKHHGETPSPARLLATRGMQFTIAVYGGYFGAGIGILMLAMLQLMGYTHIHRMNALKTTMGSAINAVAVLMFVGHSAVPWEPTLVMIVGGIAGGYFGARLALKVKPEYVRLLVSIIGFSMTAYFFLHK